MKSGLILKWMVGLSMCSLALTGGCLEENSAPPPVVAIGDADATTPPPVTPVVYEEEAPAAAPAVDPSTAPATPVETAKPIPADLQPSAPVAEVIKMANSGVEPAVLLSYVTNSPSVFNLSADQIIYLNDIGVAGDVVTAMIQHDQALKTAANAPLGVTTVPTPPPAPPPGGGYPAPTETAPPPSEPVTAPLTPPAGAEAPAYDQFYGSLSPYGTWVDVAGYGRCWQPTVVLVNPGWQPYFDGGHWVYTDAGWYWYSDYSWGWAPFHYGRWFHHYRMGWCWAPDRVWGPSWVCWRDNDAYCGWAPLPPGCTFSFSLGLCWRGHRIRDWDDCGLGRDHFRFVAWNDFHDRRYNGHELDRHHVDQIYNKTVVVNKIVVNNKTVINQGISPDRVATVSHRQVQRVALHEVNGARPVNGRVERLDRQNRTLTVYRPQAPAEGRRSGGTTETVRSTSRYGTTETSTVTRGGSVSTTRSVDPRPTRVPERLVAPKQDSLPSNERSVVTRSESAPARNYNAEPAPSRTTTANTPVTRSQPSNVRTYTPPAAQRDTAVAPNTSTTTTRQLPGTVRPTPSVNRSAPAVTRPTPSTTRPVPAPNDRNGLQLPQSGFGQTRAQPTAPSSTPWLANRPSASVQTPAPRQYTAPAPVQRQYTPPAQTYTPPAQVQRQYQYSAPAARQYTPPAAPAYSAPQQREVPRQQYTPPSRPSAAESPRYSAPAPQSRPAPSAAPANRPGNDNRGGNPR